MEMSKEGAMKKILSWLDAHFEDFTCGVLLLVVMSMLMAQVFVRFVFGHGLTFSEELTRFCFLFFVYISTSLVAMKGMHIRVTGQMKLFPRKAALGLYALADTSWLTFNAVVIWQGAKLIQSMATFPMISGGLLIDLRYVYVILPVAFALQSLRIMQRWYRFSRGTLKLVPDEEL